MTGSRWRTLPIPKAPFWRSKIDCTERVQLTFPPLFVLMPRWSPDATRIAFTGKEPGKALAVYVISAEGGNPERPFPEGRGTANPTWSSDGNSFVFARFSPNEPSDVGTQDLAILDVGTHAISTVPGSRELWWPNWSPDGRHIIAVPPAGERLMIFDVNTQKWTELARIGAGYYEWTRNGDYVYFIGVPPGGQPSGIFRVQISDRHLEEVFSLKDVRQAPGWGEWVGLAPDDSPLLARDTGTQDVYALDWEAP